MSIIIVCLLVLALVQGMEGIDLVVGTDQGTVRGLTSDDGEYSMFLGIPYGKVDEHSPFGVAQSYPNYTDEFLANNDSSICPHIDEFDNTIVGTLDCLRLNIYVPKISNSENKLPVLIWIHGGGFQVGSGGRFLYGPDFLIKHNIILVTLNYRLGPYGFMCLDTPEVPGNQGLKDQLLALRWIRDNIAFFNGDVNTMTLMGKSAGAASVEFHLWSKQDKLYNQIILQSGSVFGPWAISNPDYTQPLKLAESLGYKTENPSDAISFLATTEVKLVMDAVKNLSMEFKVCVETKFDDVESILSEHPRKSTVPKARNTPILTGFNSHELLIPNIDGSKGSFEMNVFHKSLSQKFDYDEDFYKMEDIVRHFYIGDEIVSEAVRWHLTDFASDHHFIYPVHESLQVFLNNGAEKIYHYMFSYSGERNLLKKLRNVTENGAAHSDELSYLFHSNFDPSTPTTEDQQIVDKITTLWTNFVKHGDPTPETTELLPLKWLPVTNEAFHYLNINSELSMGKRPLNDRMAFWNLFFEANEGNLKDIFTGTVDLTEGRLGPLVKTNQGTIRGLTSDGGDYSMFLGIPFGKIDKENPFGVAKPYPKFDNIFLANDDSAICPQEEEFNKTIVGTLDCLHLNIYVPNSVSSGKKLPVLVWIYGGGFQVGFAGRFLYGPENLIRHDVILVTVNYRVGVYGFMCLDTPEVPGNQGLKDQLLGLRWINKNIAYFSGDANKVTLMGQSAGAASVDFHLWSRPEKMFNQIILQSGSVFSQWAMAKSDLTQPIILAKRLGYETALFSDAISFLARSDVKLVTTVAATLPMYFKICVEKEFENVESFLTEHPRNLKVPAAKNIPILTGYNSHEWMKLYINEPESAFKNINVFNTSMNEVFHYDEDFFEMEKFVRHFYIGDEEITKAVEWNLVDFHSDHDFIYPVQESIQKYLNAGAVNLYHYLFSYSGERNYIKKRLNMTGGGAAHEDEISYLFKMVFDPSTPSKEDQKMIDILTTLWTNFVKYGEPTPETTELLPIKWLPVTKDALNYLSISSELSMAKRPFKERMAFWNLLVAANKKKLKGYNPESNRLYSNGSFNSIKHRL